MFQRRTLSSFAFVALLTLGSLAATQAFGGAITVTSGTITGAGPLPLVAVSGTAPNGNTWASYVTGTSPVAYFDLGTGTLMFDPKGKNASTVDWRYGYFGTIGSGTVGPYVFTTGTGQNAISSTSVERTLPTGVWSNVTTFQARLSGFVGNTASLATSGGNIASTTGWFNQPWSFGAIAPTVTQSLMYSTTAGQGFRAVASVNNPAPVDLLGYGNGFGMFSFVEAGVGGGQYGAVIPVQAVPEPAALVLAGLGVAGLLARHTQRRLRHASAAAA